jgi:hypothetical protein
MRLGTIEINVGDIVELDDEAMVEAAKEAIYEDLQNKVNFTNPMSFNIESDKGNSLSENDIPEFLRRLDCPDWIEDIPEQCWSCGNYKEEGEVKIVDTDPGDPEVGPNPSIEEVWICNECIKR